MGFILVLAYALCCELHVLVVMILLSAKMDIDSPIRGLCIDSIMRQRHLTHADIMPYQYTKALAMSILV
jgi:hypothetical protein